MDDRGELVEFTETAIGGGSYGVVFRLENHNPPAVVKYIRDEFDEIFKKELKALERLTHPNIVSFFGTREKKDYSGVVKLGLVMEYCQRGPLDKLIFDPKIVYQMYTVVSWARDLYSALHYLFIFGFIHGDISPYNILITEDFTVKIGDFGSNKEASKTCTGTLIGTRRYMSPPQVVLDEEEKRISKNLISHRNDVYSLALVLWELIERRKVLSEYGISSFQYVNFLSDSFQKKILGILAPDCQENVQLLLSSCYSFDQTTRPSAEEVCSSFEGILVEYNRKFHLISKDDSMKRIQYLPRIEETQKFLIKPIGFDNTDERIPIKNLFSEGSIPEIFVETDSNGSEKIFSPGTHVEETLSTLRLSNIALGSGCSARKDFTTKFEQLFIEEKLAFLEKAPTIVGKQSKKVHIFQEPYYPKGLDFKNSQDEPIERLFENILAWDLHEQFSAYGWVFNDIECYTKSRLIFWEIYKTLLTNIEYLNIMKKCGYTWRLSMKCYLSMENKEEWLLLEIDETRNISKFMKKDFNCVKEMSGEWVKTRKVDEFFGLRMFLVKEMTKMEKIHIRTVDGLWNTKEIPVQTKNKPSFLADQLHYSHIEPVDIYILIGALEKMKDRVEKSIRIQMENYRMTEVEAEGKEELKLMEALSDGEISKEQKNKTSDEMEQWNSLNTFDMTPKRAEQSGENMALQTENQMEENIIDSQPDSEHLESEYQSLTNQDTKNDPKIILRTDIEEIPEIQELENASCSEIIELDRAYKAPELIVHRRSINGLFEWRNPPRPICRCSPKCPITGRLPEFEDIDKIADDLRIPYYQCSSKSSIQYLENHLSFLEKLNKLVLSERVHYKKSQLPTNKPVLKIEKEKPKGKKNSYFIFSFYESDSEILILLDDLSDYEHSETIPCLDQKWNLHFIEAIKVWKHLHRVSERRFVAIDMELNAWEMKVEDL